jgi:antitoxin YefM
VVEEFPMTIKTTYTNARANFAKLWDEVVENSEVVIISRRGSEDVAMISASELASLAETAHLLRSSKNAERLLAALQRANVRTLKSQTTDELRREIKFEEEKRIFRTGKG